MPTQAIISEEFGEIVSNNPCLNRGLDERFFHITFLANKPISEDKKLLEQMTFENEEFHIIHKVVYLFLSEWLR